MPIRDATTISVPKDLANRIRDKADDEDRAIVAVVERMTDLYQDLEPLTHLLITDTARALDLTPGQALNIIVQSWHASGAPHPAQPCLSEVPQ